MAKAFYISLAEDESYKPCPICGKRDRMFVMAKDFYENLMRLHGRSTMEIECNRCHLQLLTYSHHFIEELGYDKRIEDIRDKWNTRAVSE